MGMKHRSSCDAAAKRAWRLLRLALLWARKGGLLKCKLMAELRLVPKYLKGLNHHKTDSQGMIRYYGERQLSFDDDTPVLHLRMSRPNSLRFMIPCIKPEVTDFDYDFGNVDEDGLEYPRKSTFLEYNAGDNSEEVRDNEGDQGIDDKAEEFIAQFYAQMKMQRQISFLQKRNAVEVI